MTFEDAENMLAELAGDKYYSLQYERTRYGKDSGGGQEQACRLYIAPGVDARRPTWAEAFASLTAKLNGTPDPTLLLHDEGPESELPA